MLFGYARVSKGETQDTRLQETALRAAGSSGCAPSRPRAGAGTGRSCNASSISCGPRMWWSSGNATASRARARISSI